MTDLDIPAEGDHALDPDEVSARSFPTAFRGFDPVQVRAFLGDVADELRRLRDQEASLRRALEQQPAEVATADPEIDPSPGLAAASEAAAAEDVVDQARAEADRLLKEARERVEQLGAAATAETTRVLEEARAEAARLRATAIDDLKGRFEEAEASAVRKIAEAEREAASMRVTAREEADATIEAARDRGREMVAEAQAARERMLADLAKRKRAAQAQLEQLRAGRDRLLDTLKVARRSIDEMTNRFDTSDGGSAATTPPSSGMPSGSVTTTPGASSTEARPRAAGAGAGAADVVERPRPVRSRAVALGEAPAPAPAPSARPQVAAPQARAIADAAAPDPAPEPAPAPPAAPAPASSPTGQLLPPPAAEAPAEAPAPAAPPRGEERRSSALRILRRSKPADVAPTPPLIGRDSPNEGVRIIGRPAAVAPPPEAPPDAEPERPEEPPPAPEPEPEVVAVAAVEAPPVAPVDAGEDSSPSNPPDAASTDLDAGTWTAAVDDAPRAPAHAADPAPSPAPVPPAEVGVAAETSSAAAAADTRGADAGEPLAVEEIRPRIEDLFARIRADREAATASARQVLAAAPDPPDGREPGTEATPTASTAPPAEPAADAPAAGPDPSAPAAAATDADEHRLQARDAVSEPLIAQLTKRLKRALQDEQNSTLDRLRTSRGRASVDQVLSGPDDQALPYRHLALPFLDKAARGGATASPHGPIAVGTDDLAAQLADDLAGAVRARLDSVLQTAASDDLDLASLSERISSVYREWKVQKVERLATHYVIAAHERGSFLAHPEGTPLRWLVDDDGPCPDCDDNALAGPTPRGEAFPTGQLHPPAHLGCRCLLGPTPA